MDKDVSKRLFQAAGIPVVPYLVFRRHEFDRSPKKVVEAVKAKFGFPVFVKPANTGSSVGVHKVKSESEAVALIADSFKYDTKVLVEQAVAARELEVAVLGNHEPRASIVGEIVPTHEFYSYEAKYIDENGAILKIPAEGLAPELVKKIQEFALRAFLAIECRGMARVDFFLDKKTGELFLNEINTIPGFTQISMYPKLWEASGVPYKKLLDELIRLALEENSEKGALKLSYEPQ
jgi:D-alanine-D-alanine ligase